MRPQAVAAYGMCRARRGGTCSSRGRLSDHSPTHFRDPGKSEDSSEKKTRKNERDVLETIEDITWSIFECFAIL